MGYVKYVGTADIRQISVDDWKAVGVDDMETVVWAAHNGWTVPDSKFSDAAWPIIKADRGLVLLGDREGQTNRAESIAQNEAREEAQKAAAADANMEPPTGPDSGSTARSGTSKQRRR